MTMRVLKSKLNRGTGLRQRGIVIVEAVIILPVVLFLILAVAELSNAILQYNVLTRAVRDSARYVAGDAGANAGVINLTAAKITTAQNLAAYGTAVAGTAVLPGLVPGNITVAVVNTGDVSVSAQYQYQPLFADNIPELLGVGNAGGTFTMSAHVIMRIL
jgi:Flp pilus assembly protein TadG